MPVNLETMSMNELRTLKANINVELERRTREEYYEAVEEFRKAFYKLYNDFPFEPCMADGGETWEELYENYDWGF